MGITAEWMQAVAGLRAQVTAVGDLPSVAQASAASAVQTSMQLLHAVASCRRWSRFLPTLACIYLVSVLECRAA